MTFRLQLQTGVPPQGKSCDCVMAKVLALELTWYCSTVPFFSREHSLHIETENSIREPVRGRLDILSNIPFAAGRPSRELTQNIQYLVTLFVSYVKIEYNTKDFVQWHSMA